MAKKQSGGKILNFVVWFTGVIVSLAVSFGMIEKVLRLPSWLGGTTAIGSGIVVVVGWIALVTTLISAVMAILRS
jgi:hypothetical protein